jgi:phosphoribosylformylglycinamidine synthase subunit PurQ / glutaminase
MKPRALILFAVGTNRDGDAAVALEQAGADAVIIPLSQLRDGKTSWKDYQLLIIPGGFSYGDALGAGKLLANDLIHYFSGEVHAFVEAGKPVLGICNGFQALVKSGILPGGGTSDQKPWATLTFNDSNHFECRWISLKSQSTHCLWIKGLDEIIDCPVAHGEGKFTVSHPSQARDLVSADQVAFTYTYSDGQPARGAYPVNPNGSILDIAGICNPRGNVLGLMPHPEDHIYPYQTPDKSGRPGHYGLALFQNGVRFAAEI